MIFEAIGNQGYFNHQKQTCLYIYIYIYLYLDTDICGPGILTNHFTAANIRTISMMYSMLFLESFPPTGFDL